MGSSPVLDLHATLPACHWHNVHSQAIPPAPSAGGSITGLDPFFFIFGLSMKNLFCLLLSNQNSS